MAEIQIHGWRSMVNDPPSKTGRYVVAHRGGVGGDAFYTAREGDTHLSQGWSQVPPFGPTHWLDGPTPTLDSSPRVWASPPPAKRPARQGKRWWQFGCKRG
jgi:hypothetical protein